MGANFRSDNVAGIDPAILEAVARANAGPSLPYGNDAVTQRVEQRLAEVFETDVAVFPVATGTAANALCLAAAVPSWGAVYCHAESHILLDECNAPEFYTGGARLVPLAGAQGRLAPESLAATLAAAPTGVHHAQPAAVSITQLSESGTAYKPDHVAAIGQICRERCLVLHMDGSRFANALAGLNCSPADLTWRAGVDLLSFGATKNGAIAAEAIVVFRKDLAASLAYRRKRAGHLFSKMRFLSAQLEAYLDQDRWLDNARHANAQAKRLARGLGALSGVTVTQPVDGNEVFAEMPTRLVAAIEAEGFALEPWAPATGDKRLMRLVAAFDTDPKDVEALIAAANRRQAA
ncbi:MAG: low specificity L-threonine aldolase [Alphaproteobacteria bacterium]|nr:low specificity L-threonine aldolase [Alphaproteobacteria bacterium]